MLERSLFCPMSVPVFDPAPPVAPSWTIDLEEKFPATNRFRIFSEKIYPILAKARNTLAPVAYCLDNGRKAIEPLWLLGATVLQFLERVPDRQAAEMISAHAGWNLALRRTGKEKPFEFSALHYFRDRLIQHEQSDLIFKEVRETLIEAGFIPPKSARRLDSTQMWGLGQADEPPGMHARELAAGFGGSGRDGSSLWQAAFLVRPLGKLCPELRGLSAAGQGAPTTDGPGRRRCAAAL